MLFAGGSPEVQKLVQQAVAARSGAAAPPSTTPAPVPAGAPAPEPAPAYAAAPAAQNTPPTVGPRRTHGAAIAATVVSMPAAKIPGMPGGHLGTLGSMPGAGPGSSQVTPPPVAATPPLQPLTPPPQALSPAPTPKQAAGGNFRETLWFKKGDVDQMVAEARARVEASRAKGIAVSAADAEAAAVAEVAAPEAAAGPLDERYVDDGSVTADDRKKFSLRSGATSTALPTVGGQMPGERMSDAEVMGEIGGKKRMTIIIVAALLLAAIVGVVVKMMTGKKDVSKNAAALMPPTIPTDQPAPHESAPTPVPPPPGAATKPPAPPAVAKEIDEPTPKAPAHPAAKKHVVAKKAKGKKAHR
jgi:hypothetical protein